MLGPVTQRGEGWSLQIFSKLVKTGFNLKNLEVRQEAESASGEFVSLFCAMPGQLLAGEFERSFEGKKLDEVRSL